MSTTAKPTVAPKRTDTAEQEMEGQDRVPLEQVIW